MTTMREFLLAGLYDKVASLFTRRESEIQVTARTIEDTPAGPILAICFAGHYPPGSLGNTPCAKMISRAKSLITEPHPAALLFDLTHLDYVWGDSIGGGIISLAFDKSGHGFLPTCLVARGRTAKALNGLMSLGLDKIGFRLFKDEEEAVDFLRQKLGQQAV